MGLTHRGSLSLTDIGSSTGVFLANANTTAPDTKGQLVYKSGTGFQGFGESGAFTILASGTAGQTWDSMYDTDKTLTIDTLAMNWLITANVNGFAFNKTGTGAGNVIDITNVGTGYDIDGSSSLWYIDRFGTAVVQNLILGDSDQVRFGASADCTIDYDASGAALDISTTVNFEGPVTHAASQSETWTGVGGSTILTLTAGDVVMSDGSIAITDADNAASFSLTNDAYITGNLVNISAGSIITGNVLQITAAQIDSGNFIDLDNSGGGMTGYYITCNDDNTVEFAVGADGAVDIVGSLNSTQGLHVTGICTAENMVLFDNTAGSVAADKAVLSLDAGGDIAAGGNILRVAATGAAPTADAILVEILGTADVQGLKIDFGSLDTHEALYIDADSTDKDIAYITSGAVIATDKALLDLDSDGKIASGGNILRIDNAGVADGGGAILAEIIAGTGSVVGLKVDCGSKNVTNAILVTDADNVAGDAVAIGGTGALSAGHMLSVTSDGAPAAATDSLVQFSFAGTDTNTPIIQEITSSADVTGLKIVAEHAAQLTHPLDVRAESATGAIQPVRIQQDDTNVGFLKMVGSWGSTAAANLSEDDVTATGSACYFLVDLGGTAVWLQGYYGG